VIPSISFHICEKSHRTRAGFKRYPEKKLVALQIKKKHFSEIFLSGAGIKFFAGFRNCLRMRNETFPSQSSTTNFSTKPRTSTGQYGEKADLTPTPAAYLLLISKLRIQGAI
jgi:hypothetical protein